MSTKIEQAGEDVIKLARQIQKDHHPDLADVAVDVLMKAWFDSDGTPTPGMTRHGVPASAMVKVCSEQARAQGAGDAVIVIDAAAWESMHPNERAALLDHELEHIEPTDKTDSHGRPKLQLRPHDWELAGFRSVVQRHEDAAPEQRAYAEFAQSESGQFIMEFAAKG